MNIAALIARTENGEVLYDTSKSIFGLIKSGPVEYHGRWRRYQSIFYDNIYKFTVEGAISPLVFTVGDCGKPIQSKEGNTYVFYFLGPESFNIKVYCFDVMAPIFSGPALKTRNSAGEFTFNSLQRPLNIIGTNIPPPPSGPWSDKVPVAPLSGGSAYVAQYIANPLAGWGAYGYSVALDPNIEYAAHIPWARGCFSAFPAGGNQTYMGGMSEGCSGYKGGIRHVFYAAPETSYEPVHSTFPTGVYSLVYGPRPSCSYINTAEYPYPFNPAR